MTPERIDAVRAAVGELMARMEASSAPPKGATEEEVDAYLESRVRVIRSMKTIDESWGDDLPPDADLVNIEPDRRTVTILRRHRNELLFLVDRLLARKPDASSWWKPDPPSWSLRFAGLGEHPIPDDELENLSRLVDACQFRRDDGSSVAEDCCAECDEAIRRAEDARARLIERRGSIAWAVESLIRLRRAAAEVRETAGNALANLFEPSAHAKLSAALQALAAAERKEPTRAEAE